MSRDILDHLDEQKKAYYRSNYDIVFRNEVEAFFLKFGFEVDRCGIIRFVAHLTSPMGRRYSFLFRAILCHWPWSIGLPVGGATISAVVCRGWRGGISKDATMTSASQGHTCEDLWEDMWVKSSAAIEFLITSNWEFRCEFPQLCKEISQFYSLK